MPVSKRQQPKRRVNDITRVGSYPSVWWEHRLECGHIERRKRKSASERIACEKCGAAAGLAVFDEAAALSEYQMRVEAKFAHQFKVDPEFVTVQCYMDGGYPRVATVHMSLYRDIL